MKHEDVEGATIPVHAEKSMSSVGEEFPKEQARVRELIALYRSLPGGVGNIGAMLMEGVLQRADQAAISGDVVAMVRSFEEMRGCE